MASFNERLIREVKKYNKLWDQHSKLHKEASSRETAWADIAETLGVTVKECQTRWRSIRDMYLKRKKRLPFSSKGQGNVLEHELSFLDGFLKPRTRCQLRPVVFKLGLDEGGSPGCSSASSTVPLPSPPESPDLQWVLVLEEPPMAQQLPPAPPPPTPLTQGASRDQDELFCLSLMDHLRRIPPMERHVARAKVLQTLQQIEFGLPDNSVAPALVP
ncbi:uncharacterized protein LOC144163543 [Haemaphysalis longicornis]